MLDPREVTVVCAPNDLEGVTISALARRAGAEVIEIPGPWGTRLVLRDVESHEAAIRAHVVVVEFDTAAVEAYLAGLGARLFRIDHHVTRASNGEAVPRRSALEQFADMIGVELTPDEWRIAIYDRDFLAGLAKAGVKWEDAKGFADRELRLQGEEQAMEEALTLVAGRARDLDDLRISLAPLRLGRVMLKAAQWPAESEYAKLNGKALRPALVLLHEEGEPRRIRQVEYAGPAGKRAALAALVSDAGIGAEFDMWVGGGALGCYFGAKVREGHPSPDIDNLISRLVSRVLSMGRPLRTYECTFHLAVDLRLETEIDEDVIPMERHLPSEGGEHTYANVHRLVSESAERAGVNAMPNDATWDFEAQGWHYLLPQLRGEVYDVASAPGGSRERGGTPITQWRLRSPETLELRLERKDPAGLRVLPPMRARVVDVSLYRYFNGLYLLAVRVAPVAFNGTAFLKCDEESWWHALVYSSDEEFASLCERQLGEWLAFTKLVRILYPSFAGQDDEGKIQKVELIETDGLIAASRVEMPRVRIRDRIGDEISEVVLNLLARFFAPVEAALARTVDALKRRLDFVPEDRMFVNVAYGLLGPEPQGDLELAEFERLFSLALYVDAPADTFPSAGGYAYDRKFTRRLMEADALKRWTSVGTLSGYTCYSNAYMGYGWFFNNVVGPIHVPFIYGRLLILTLFYLASLRHYERRLTLLTGAKDGIGDLRAFRELRAHFIRFTNQYWFREVTPQVQGKEVFERQSRGLGLDGQYDLIKDKMERSDEYSQTQFQIEINERADKFAFWALVIGVAALIGGTFQVIGGITSDESTRLNAQLLSKLYCSGAPGLILVILAVLYAILLIAVAFWAVWWCWRMVTRRRRPTA